MSLVNTIVALRSYGIEMKVLCAYDSMKSFFEKRANVPVGKIFNPCLLLGRVPIGYANLFNIRSIIRILQEFFLLPVSIIKQFSILKRESPDIVHLNSSILFTSAIAAKMAGIPLVWHVREVVLGGRFNIRKALAGWFIRSIADKVVAISPYCARSLGRDKKGAVEVVYNFVDFSSFNSDNYNAISERESFGIKAGERLIVSLGGVSFRKGTVELIEAMRYTSENIRLALAGPPLIHSDIDSAKTFLIGLMHFIEDILIDSGLKGFYSWYYSERVKKAFVQLPQGKVIFLGYVKDVACLLAASDLLVFAGTRPHFPRPVYEAWAMKKPVVAFDMGGVSDEIEDGTDGVIVKKCTGKMLAASISALLNSPEKMRSMAEAGYVKSTERFDLKKNVSRLMDVYHGLLKGNTA